MLPLASTPNKQAIRRYWDKQLIKTFSRFIRKPQLDYFGLPGPDIGDFLDWKNHLGWKTGVELLTTGKEREEQLKRINKIQSNVILNGFSNKWDLRRGSIEDVILDGVDIDGNKPALLTHEKGKTVSMNYDLHNWDFQGGLYKTDKGESKRVEAIKRCIALQKNHPFLFLLTLNVRHTLGQELSIYLDGARSEAYSTAHKKILKWYSQRGSIDNSERYRIKSVVNLFIRQIAHVNSFDCYCYPPVYYEGWKEHLLHFVFSLIPQGTVLPSFSKQKIGEVLELPLVEANDGKFSFAEKQHPNFSMKKASRLCSHLGLPIIPNKAR